MGFEPTEHSHVRRFSRPLRSTTPAFLRKLPLNNNKKILPSKGFLLNFKNITKICFLHHWLLESLVLYSIRLLFSCCRRIKSFNNLICYINSAKEDNACFDNGIDFVCNCNRFNCIFNCRINFGFFSFF